MESSFLGSYPAINNILGGNYCAGLDRNAANWKYKTNEVKCHSLPVQFCVVAMPVELNVTDPYLCLLQILQKWADGYVAWVVP